MSSEVSSNDDSVDKIKNEAKNVIRKVFDDIGKSSGTKQLMIGTASGWTTGYITMKVGKTTAIAVGGGIILLQIAQQKGYIKIDWNKVKQSAKDKTENIVTKNEKETSKWLDIIKDFAKDNTCFAAGFLGGFLIGLAS